MQSLWFSASLDAALIVVQGEGANNSEGDVMRKTRRIEITIETDQVLSISRRFATWCGACADLTVMVRVDEAAALAGVNERTVYWRMETGQLHCTETPTGLQLICLNSLLKSHGGYDV